jgi:large-conductance mechanosensitive channel
MMLYLVHMMNNQYDLVVPDTIQMNKPDNSIIQYHLRIDQADMIYMLTVLVDYWLYPIHMVYTVFVQAVIDMILVSMVYISMIHWMMSLYQQHIESIPVDQYYP